MSGPVDAAVARLAKRKPKAIVLQQQSLAIADEPIVVRHSGEMSFTRGERADPATPNLLLWDPRINAWRAVLTPPGTAWELVEKQQGPSIWKPGMRT